MEKVKYATYVICSLLIFFALAIAGAKCTWTRTCYHLESDLRDYEYVAGDMKTDVGYYRYVGKSPRVFIGEVVNFGEVRGTDVYGFYVQPEFAYELNTAVYNEKGQQVGIIHSELANGLIFCQWN